MKKFLSLLLAVMMIVSCVPAMAEDLIWNVNESLGTLKLSSDSKAAGRVEIPAEVDGTAVLALDYMCFKSCYDITELVIPDTVRFFERNTLNGASSLTALTLPRDLIVIKNGSLTDMPLIETLVVPASVSVVNGAFSNLPALKSITFEGVCPIFAKDSYYPTFDALSAECIIYVPDDQVDAYKAAFADREDVLNRIQPSGKNAVVIDWTAPESDFQFDAATGTITGYTGSASRLEIPAAIGGVPVKHIGKQAFLQKYTLMYVTIPEGVETIEKQAFHGCSLMTYVSLPTTLHTIGDSAFNSNNLVEVGWSEGLVTVGSKAFYNCDICYAVLPTTLTTIGDSGFENAGFVDVTFGPNVETVGEKGFAAKTIEAITYTGTTMPAFGADAFKGCNKSATLTLADGCPKELYDGFVTYMADAFPKCTVNEPVFAATFPALDAEAGAPFIGTWNGVAVFDGSATYGMDLLGMSVVVVLNADGTGSLSMDGEAAPGCWYVENGAAVFAPIYEEGGQPVMEEAIPMPLDENNRMVIDLGGLYLMMELEGMAYADSLIPAASSGSSVEGAEMLLGDWYDDVGNKLTLTEDGVMTFTWAFDGWVDEYTWAVVDGAAVVTSGSWNGLPITLENGILMITNGEGIFQIFSIDGDLSAYYGDDPGYELPETEPIGPEGEAFFGTWIGEMYGMPVYLTLNQDGTCAIEMFGEVEPGVWSMMGDKAYVMGDELYIDGNGSLVMPSAEVSFTKAGGAAPAPAPAPAGIPHIEATADDYIGGWICVEMPSMQLLLLDGEANMIDGTELYTTTWEVVDGVAEFDGMKLYTQEDWSGILDMGDGTLLTFERGYVEKPKAPAATPVPAPAEPAADVDVSAFIGEWTLETMMGMPAAELYMTMTLTINEDGSVSMYDGYSVESNFWTIENGAFVIDGEALVIVDGKLSMSDGLMIFAPGGYVEPAPAPSAPEAPAAGGFSSYEDYMGIKFVATTFTSYGTTMDASALGAEYSVLFRADGTCDFTMAGLAMPNLPWGLQEVAVGLTKTSAFVINYYGVNYSCIPTETGFDMDFYGTMNLHFVPAQ